METKLPLISYVVKTQFITNNSGLRRIHQQVFTDQNILFAREKAFEYYEAAIDVLEREGEICRDERTNKIIYKNPENYLKGISIYIRINEDVKKYSLADKENQMYLINIHFSLNEILKRRLEQGKKTEKKYFDILKINFNNKHSHILSMGRRLEEISKKNKILAKSANEIEFIEFKKENRKSDIEMLLESICAFANSDGGTIILGQKYGLDSFSAKENIISYEYIINRLISCIYKDFAKKIIIKAENILGCNFISIVIPKSEQNIFYNGVFLYRNNLGNVIDFDRNFH